MKFIIASLSLLLTLRVYAGGVSGGGGGTVPADPISAQDLRKIVEEERWELKQFFNAYEIIQKTRGKGNCQDSVCEKLFNGEHTIFSVLDSDINFQESAPCLGPDGEPHDGYAADQSICLSLFSMVQKLDVSEARPQVLALIGHELSHLVALDEKEADQVQKAALKAFWSKREEEMSKRRESVKSGMREALEELELSRDMAEKNSEVALYNYEMFVENARYQIINLAEELRGKFSFSFISLSNYGAEDEAFWRLVWVLDALVSSGKTELDNVFSGASELTIKQAYENNAKNNFKVDFREPFYSYRPEARIYRVTDSKTLVKELDAIIDIYRLLIEGL